MKENITIINRAKNGDEEAFLELYNLYYHRAYLYALKICRNEADAQDAVQDAFVSIHKALPNLKQPEYFSTWLFKIVFTKCTLIFRRNKDAIIPSEKLEAMNFIEHHNEYNPEMFVREQSDKDIFFSFVEKLDPKFRDVIKAVYLDQKSLKEVSDLLQIPIGTVKSRTAQGKKQLKVMIDSFEHKEARRLNFKLQTPVGFGIFAVLLSKLKYGAQLASGEVLKVAIILSISTITVCAGAGVYQHYQRNLNPQHLPEQQAKFPQERMEESKNAYFKLLRWAASKDEMALKTDAEIASIRPLYEKMKNENNVYHSLLESLHWFENYENL